MPRNPRADLANLRLADPAASKVAGVTDGLLDESIPTETVRIVGETAFGVA